MKLSRLRLEHREHVIVRELYCTEHVTERYANICIYVDETYHLAALIFVERTSSSSSWGLFQAKVHSYNYNITTRS